MPPVTLPTRTEFKNLAFTVKSVNEDQGIVTGYLSTFNNIDLGNGYIRDRVLPGAFKKTLTEAKSRASARGKKYLLPHLWMHDPEKPLGGYIDAKEDERGLLVTFELDISTNAAGFPNNPQAALVFSGHKRGYIDEQSIGYEVIQSELVEEVVDGKKTMVRNLIELRLLEGSSVTSNFAMNPEATDTGVKYAVLPLYAADRPGDALVETKATICGDTSGPIGPRDEAWDGSKAKAQIFAAAEKEDGSLDASVCRKYFMVLDGDPQQKGSWGYPFWYVGSSPHICVGAVKAIAGLIQGARGADAPVGLKPKIEKLYARINKQYPDDPELVPPWKGRVAPTADADVVAGVAHKSFEELYENARAADVFEDWGDLVDTLTKTMIQIFSIGDEPQADMQDALAQFGKAVMDWVAMAVECKMADYVADRFGPLTEPYLPYFLRVGGLERPDAYGLAARTFATALHWKAGRAISAATRQRLQDHTEQLKTLARRHASAVRDAADAFVEQMARATSDRSTPPPEDAEDEEQEENTPDQQETPPTSRRRRRRAGNDDGAAKVGRTISAANMAAITEHANTMKQLASEHAKALHTAASDLSTLWAEQRLGPAYAADEDDNEEEEEEEGRGAIRREQQQQQGGSPPPSRAKMRREPPGGAPHEAFTAATTALPRNNSSNRKAAAAPLAVGADDRTDDDADEAQAAAILTRLRALTVNK